MSRDPADPRSSDAAAARIDRVRDTGRVRDDSTLGRAPDFSAFRAGLPVVTRGTFLNHAATCPVTDSTIAAIQAAAARMTAPLDQYFFEALATVEQTRRLLAELMGAHPSEVAFAANTSTAISIAADAIRLKPGDRVLVPADEFPSNRYPWQNLSRKGVRCDLFDVTPGVPMVDVLQSLDLAGVRAISISSTSYRTGRCHDLVAFADFCRERDIFSVVDIIQSVGAMEVDLHAAGVDIACSGAQKWLLAPVGVGILYARQALLDELDVPLAGWTSTKYPESFEIAELEFASEMTRFEPGLPNILALEGLHASLRELGAIGWNDVFAAVARNVAHVTTCLAERGIATFADDEGRAGIASFDLPPGAPGERHVHDALHAAKITVTNRDGYVRISPHFHTTFAEIDAFFDTWDRTPGLGRATDIKHTNFTSTRVSANRQPIGMQVSDEKTTRAAGAQASGQAAKREGGSDRPIALVTGATGILGEQVCAELARRGFDLVAVARNRAALDALAAQVTGSVPDANVHGELVDLTDRVALGALVERLRRGRGISVLANLAAVAFAEPLMTATAAELDEQLEVDARAPIVLTRAFLADLKSSDAVGVLNVVSSAGRCGSPLLAGYGAANAALWTFSETVAREVAADGITVTTFVASQMHSRMQKRIGRVALRYFKIAGASFDAFDHPEQTAARAVDALLSGRTLDISKANRRKVIANVIAPRFVEKRIAAAWQQ